MAEQSPGRLVPIASADGIAFEVLRNGRAGPGSVLKTLVDFAERRLLRDAEEQGLTDVRITNVRVIVEGEGTRDDGS